MKELAVKLKALNIYAHMGHNLVHGPLFESDHEWLSSIYDSADSKYDAVIERIIGLGGDIDIVKVNMDAAAMVKPWPLQKDINGFFPQILKVVVELCKEMGLICKKYDTSEGTKQLLGGFCDEFEVLQYKLKQRLK